MTQPQDRRMRLGVVIASTREGRCGQTVARWFAKPFASILGGGLAGGLRAVEHLRLVFAERHAVTIREPVRFHNAHGEWQDSGRRAAASARQRSRRSQPQWGCRAASSCEGVVAELHRVTCFGHLACPKGVIRRAVSATGVSGVLISVDVVATFGWRVVAPTWLGGRGKSGASTTATPPPIADSAHSPEAAQTPRHHKSPLRRTPQRCHSVSDRLRAEGPKLGCDRVSAAQGGMTLGPPRARDGRTSGPCGSG